MGEGEVVAQLQTKSGIQISYDDKKRRILENLLRTLIASIKAGDFLAGFHVSPPLLAFCSLIKISGMNDDDLKASLAFRAGITLQDHENLTIEEFLDVFGGAIREYLDRPQQEYHLLFPINIKRNKIPNVPIVINGVSFEIYEWQDIQKKYDLSSLIAEVRKYIEFVHDPIYWDNNSTPLMAKVFGRNAEEVFRVCKGAYDLYRSFLNFYLDRSIRVQLSRLSPLASVVSPVGYGVFLTDGKLESPYINLEHLNYQALCKEGVDEQQIQTLINKSNSRANADIRLIEAIKSHSLGLEAANWENSFLAFWRVFEILAFGNRTDYNMNDVVNRMCTLIGAKDDGIKEFLMLCAHRRNSLVHRGNFPIEGQSLVLTLKYYSKLGITSFLRIGDSFSTEKMIEEYYMLANSTTEDLLERKDVVERILSVRNG